MVEALWLDSERGSSPPDTLVVLVVTARGHTASLAHGAPPGSEVGKVQQASMPSPAAVAKELSGRTADLPFFEGPACRAALADMPSEKPREARQVKQLGHAHTAAVLSVALVRSASAEAVTGWKGQRAQELGEIVAADTEAPLEHLQAVEVAKMVHP